MDSVDTLVVGAGVTGLAFANASRETSDDTILVLEAADEPGGYCKTILQDGFVWDYSGHFFHFRQPEIEAWLRARMPGREVRTVEKRSTIYHRGTEIDFPFQKNIHQLPQPDFIDCLYELYFRDAADCAAPPGSFKEMVIRRFGRGIAERFLIPYNEKLYATDLGELDADAMGRFFPHADLDAIIRNMRAADDADDASYNATFTYPLGGAIEYIDALLHDLPADIIALDERLEAVDLDLHVATTSTRQIKYGALVSSAPLPALAAMSSVQHDADAFAWNQVLVFNLGFDRKGPRNVHWTYYPDRDVCFYRVGFYDNIMDAERMSLYVELGAPAGAPLSSMATLETVLADLARVGIVTDHQLVSSHSVVLDPAYVHVTGRGTAEAARVRATLAERDVHSAGRYGAWTYCSIEDNIIEARQLATTVAR